MHKENGQVVESAVEARGAFLGRPVLVVLFVSMVLTVGLFALVYVGFFAKAVQ